MFPVKSLAEIAESVRYGYTASASETPVGPHFLRITDIVPSQIDWNRVPFCKIEEKDRIRFSLVPGDIVIARTGATVGYAKLIREKTDAVFASYLVRIRIDPAQVDPGYVGRIVESNVYKRFIMSRVGGAAQPNANAKVLSAFCIPIPERATQRRIADTLSTYDNLIENNRRRIQLLEQSARLLYKEWFVHLRFPGHEHVKIVDGVPEGWRKGVISDFYSTASGGTPSRKNPDYFTGNIPWVKTQELNGGFIIATEEMITEEAIKNSSAKLFPRHTVLVAMYGATIGQLATLSVSAASNQACCALIPREAGTNYTHAYLFMDYHKRDIVGLGQGAAQNNISQQIIKSFKMVLPRENLLVLFSESACPLFEQMEVLQKMNVKLRAARDLLLPRLMNGEAV